MMFPNRFVFALLLSIPVLASCSVPATSLTPDDSKTDSENANIPAALIQYLEIVTPELDATCTALERVHGVKFGAPDASLGNARTAELEGGGRIGVRGPMRETERPVVRPYVLVEDIEASVEAARAAGAEIAMPALEIPGQGKFAIYILGGIEHGLWQH